MEKVQKPFKFLVSISLSLLATETLDEEIKLSSFVNCLLLHIKMNNKNLFLNTEKQFSENILNSYC